MARKQQQTRGRQPAKYTFSEPTRNMRASTGDGIKRAKKAVDTVHGLANPFSDSARGSKLPDADSSRSVAVTIRDSFNFSNITAANSTTNAICLNPSLAEAWNSPTAIGGTNITFGTMQPINDYTAVAAAFGKYRIVSWGVRIYSIQAPTEQSGNMKFMTLPFAIEAGTFAYGGSFFEEVNFTGVANGDVHWISKPIGNQYLDYVDIDSTHSWNSLVVYIDGCPEDTVNVFRAEVFYNLECQVKLSSVSASLATKADDHNPTLLAAASNVHNRRDHIHKGSTSSLGTKLWGLAKNCLADLASSAVPYVGGAIGNILRGPRRGYPRLGNVEAIEVD